MSEEKQRPKIAVGVIVCRDDMVLLGKKMPGTKGEGTWCAPGGHLEWQESFDECAVREVLEETGVDLKNLKFVTVLNTPHGYADQHYVTVIMRADWHRGEPQVLEPHLFEEWKWFPWMDLPKPLYLFTEQFVQTGLNPLEYRD